MPGTFAPESRDNTARIAVHKEPSGLTYDEECAWCGGPIYRQETFVTHDEDECLTFCCKACAIEDLKRR